MVYVCKHMKKGAKPGYAVKKLAMLAGVSVRTLHLYDELGLLKPSVRTEAGYRLYGEPELLRLQQILFYKELDFSLQEISELLDDPDFDMVRALEDHREALKSKQARLGRLLETIDSTINKLRNGMALTHEELYAGFPAEKAEAWRNEAIGKHGAETVNKSERYLKSLGKEGFAKLKAESLAITEQLLKLIDHDAAAPEVQQWIGRHYEVIRKFWGTHGEPGNQAEAYAGLGDLYAADERYTQVNGHAHAGFAAFMQKAMKHFATQLAGK